MMTTAMRQPWGESIRVAAADIKLAHSVFALPFALLGAFMAADGVSRSLGGALALVVLCMFFGRTVAMLANRLLDHRIDLENPRTASRAIPSGRLSIRRAVMLLIASAAGFMLCCAGFGVIYSNWWPAALGVPVLLWIGGYGLLKRFTSLCHMYLGASLAMAPLAAAIAIRPEAVAAQPALWLLSGMVLCWVAGFDIIYALQDIDVDRAAGLYSIPSRMGARGGLWVSRGLHAVAGGCLVGALFLDSRFQILFGLGVGSVIALLCVEHITIARRGTSSMAVAFFTLNGLISCLLGALGIADILL